MVRVWLTQFPTYEWQGVGVGLHSVILPYRTTFRSPPGTVTPRMPLMPRGVGDKGQSPVSRPEVLRGMPYMFTSHPKDQSPRGRANAAQKRHHTKRGWGGGKPEAGSTGEP